MRAKAIKETTTAVISTTRIAKTTTTS